MDDKIYVGNGVEKFDGDMVTFALNLSKLKPAFQKYMYDFKGSKFINLKVCKNREGENEYGKTHYIMVDTFKPETKNAPTDELIEEAAPESDFDW